MVEFEAAARQLMMEKVLLDAARAPPTCCLVDFSETESDMPPDRVAVTRDFLTCPRPYWSRTRWYEIRGSENALKLLGIKYALHPLAIEDALRATQRPKEERYDTRGGRATVSPRSSHRELTAPSQAFPNHRPALRRRAPDRRAGAARAHRECLDLRPAAQVRDFSDVLAGDGRAGVVAARALRALAEFYEAPRGGRRVPRVSLANRRRLGSFAGRGRGDAAATTRIVRGAGPRRPSDPPSAGVLDAVLDSGAPAVATLRGSLGGTPRLSRVGEASDRLVTT